MSKNTISGYFQFLITIMMSAFLPLLFCAEDQQTAASTILPGSTRRGPNPLKTWLKGDWSCSFLRGTVAAPRSWGLKLLLAQEDWSCSLHRGTEAAPCSGGLKVLLAQGGRSCSLLRGTEAAPCTRGLSCNFMKGIELLLAQGGLNLLLAKVSQKLLAYAERWGCSLLKGERSCSLP